LCAPDTFFYDLGYADNEETLFLRWARTCGARRWSDGFGMLVEQAAESFRVWHGFLPETAPVFASLRPEK
jgi:shikimate dehydrogenase